MQPSNRIIISVLIQILLITLTACNKTSTFSLLGETDHFQQNGDSHFQRKIDILWVIDNSGSMATSQANLASNFSAFITRFQSLGFNYHMAVTTTDAYLADPFFNNPQSYYVPHIAAFRDGVTAGHSGVFVMTPANTTATIFSQNMQVGTSGSGDERAFSSMQRALTDPINTAHNFRRSDALLIVIIVSDEDDFSGDASNSQHFNTPIANPPNFVGDGNYNAPAPLLQPAEFYATWLDNYAGGRSNYSVSAIYVDSAECNARLGGGRKIGRRYAELVRLSGGQSASLCSDFGTTLSIITESIVSLASIFRLERQPVINSIRVIVNGQSVPENNSNGWTYIASENAIAFHGSAIPAQGANIQILYDPIAPR